jgi:hypothetical protein
MFASIDLKNLEPGADLASPVALHGLPGWFGSGKVFVACISQITCFQIIFASLHGAESTIIAKIQVNQHVLVRYIALKSSISNSSLE